jgi:hypothetical protein
MPPAAPAAEATDVKPVVVVAPRESTSMVPAFTRRSPPAPDPLAEVTTKASGAMATRSARRRTSPPRPAPVVAETRLVDASTISPADTRAGAPGVSAVSTARRLRSRVTLPPRAVERGSPRRTAVAWFPTAIRSRPAGAKVLSVMVTLAAVNASTVGPGTNSRPTPAMSIAPWPPRKPKDSGAAMERVEPPGVAALKRAPPEKRSSAAVEKWAAAGTFTTAPGPKTMPAGLTNQKAALGSAVESSVPEMNEGVPPVTRLTTLAIDPPSPAARTQRAVSPMPTLNWLKLWKRLFPARVPPSMENTVPDWPTVVPSPRPAAVSGLMTVWPSAAIGQPASTRPSAATAPLNARISATPRAG